MRPVARKYPLGGEPKEREGWARLPVEERLEALLEMVRFWCALKGLPPPGPILPVAQKRPLVSSGDEDRP